MKPNPFTCPRCQSHYLGHILKREGGFAVSDYVECHGDGCSWRGDPERAGLERMEPMELDENGRVKCDHPRTLEKPNAV